MTLLAPAFLLGLLALPALWLLARRRERRRPAPVSSLLVWRRLGLLPEPPRASARRADRLLLLRLAAALLLVLGLAGPATTAPPAARRLPVVVDTSPSMRAFADGVAAALDRVRGAAPAGAEVDELRSPGLRDLAAVLSSRTGDVVAITDHLPPGLRAGGRLRLVLVGEPVDNVGIASAWVDGEGRFGAVVRSWARSRSTRTVVSPAGRESLDLAPGEGRLVAGKAPEGRAEIRIEPGDRFAFDDRVVVERTPARTIALAWRGPAAPRLRLALEVAGVVFDPHAGGGLAYRVAPRAGDRLVVAPPGAVRPAGEGGAAGGGGLAPDAVPGPGVALGPALARPPAGRPLLYDSMGPLVSVAGDRVTVGIDPEGAGSTFASDPSFPVFVGEIARILGAVPAGSRIVEGIVDPAESATEPVADPGDLSGLTAGEVAEGRGPRSFAPWLFLAAAALLAFHLVWEDLRGPAPRPAEG